MSVSGENIKTPPLQSAESASLRYVEVGEARVAYRVDGQGPGLVLIPGTGGNAENNWGHMVDSFTPHWTVVRPEYSGAGNTVDKGSALTMPMVAEQVVATAEAAGIVPFDVIGYSLGGSIAAFIAAEYPEKVRSVILLTTPASQDNRIRLLLSLWRDLIQHKDLESMAKLVLINGLSPHFLENMDNAAIEELCSIIIRTNDWQGMLRQIDLDLRLDIREQLPKIQQPALVIACSHDQIVPPSHVRLLADSIPHAEYTELDSGHLAIIEQPQALVQLAIDFLRKQGN